MALTKKDKALSSAMAELIRVSKGDPVKVLLALAQVGVGIERLKWASALACAECGKLAVPTCRCGETPLAGRHGLEHEQRNLQAASLELLTK